MIFHPCYGLLSLQLIGFCFTHQDGSAARKIRITVYHSEAKQVNGVVDIRINEEILHLGRSEEYILIQLQFFR